MADIADLAQQRQELLNETALRAALGRRQAHPPSEDCMSCGEPIPDARRRVQPNCNLCVGCQSDIERGMGR